MDLPELRIGMSSGQRLTVLCINDSDPCKTAVAYTVVRKECKEFAHDICVHEQIDKLDALLAEARQQKGVAHDPE